MDCQGQRHRYRGLGPDSSRVRHIGWEFAIESRPPISKRQRRDPPFADGREPPISEENAYLSSSDMATPHDGLASPRWSVRRRRSSQT